MTFSLVEVLLLLMTIALGIGVAVFLRLATRMSHTAAEMTQVSRRVAELVPGFRAFIDDAESVTKKLQVLTETSSEIAENIHAVTGAASNVTARLSRGFDGQVGAAIAGARAGLEALRHSQSDNGSQSMDGEIEEQMERVGH
jgi:uncharacterized protein YhaN